MVKKATLIIVAICLFGTFRLCCGQFDLGTQYPRERSEYWYCGEIDMTICFSDASEGGAVYTIDGLPCELRLGFQKNAVGFLRDSDGDGISEIVLSGVWRYRKQNLVITVYEDHLFGGQFQELVFIPRQEN